MGIGILFLLVAVAAASFIVGVVAVGMQGKYSDKHPQAARFLGETAQAFNGEAEPPARLEKLFR